MEAVSDSRALALKKAAANARIACVGLDLIKNDAQAILATSLLIAFASCDEGFLYFEPSTVRSTNRPSDAVLCTKHTGLVIFECKGYSPGSIDGVRAGTLLRRVKGISKQENPFDQVRTTMFDIKNAIERRNTNCVPLLTYFVTLPNYPNASWEEDGFEANFPMDELLLQNDVEPKVLMERILKRIAVNLKSARRASGATLQEIEAAKKAFGDSHILQADTPHREKPDETLGSIIADLMLSDKELSKEQIAIVELPVSGIPRVVRGVAGSGKTVVLAIQAARYLAGGVQEDLFVPNSRRVAAVCYNQSFASLLRKQIARAYKVRTLRDIGDEITVRHLNGLMFDLSRKSESIRYISTKSSDPVDRALAYIKQLEELREWDPDLLKQLQYDVVFVDEGQDLCPEEFRLLNLLVKVDMSTGERPLIIFYDDAQNIYARQRPVWKDFGIDVARGNRSRIMKECFRNTKEIVTYAFNILLGSQAINPSAISTREFAGLSELRDSDLVQERNGLFEVQFAEREGQFPILTVHQHRDAEISSIVSEIKGLIENEAVEPEHIIVICSTNHLCEKIGRAALSELAPAIIRNIVLPASKPESERDFFIFRNGELTISTVKSAKGYESQIVFLAGCDEFSSSSEGRAEFYVGATRAKLRLHISGCLREESSLSPDTLMPELRRLSAYLNAQGLRPV